MIKLLKVIIQRVLFRLVDWFSYHMANFEYRWSWAEWDDCLELDDLSPKHFFMREVRFSCGSLVDLVIVACLIITTFVALIFWEEDDVDAGNTLQMAQ